MISSIATVLLRLWTIACAILYLVALLAVIWMCASFGSRVFPGWLGIIGGGLMTPVLGPLLPIAELFKSGWTNAGITALVVWAPWPLIGALNAIVVLLLGRFTRERGGADPA